MVLGNLMLLELQLSLECRQLIELRGFSLLFLLYSRCGFMRKCFLSASEVVIFYLIFFFWNFGFPSLFVYLG